MTNKNIPSVTFESKLLCESYEKYSHPSGLDIYVFPKKLTTTYAIFAVKYGAVNNSFSLTENGEMITVPDGIAHFLEHKLFKNEDGSDSFERFSEYGADANAYTASSKTAYLFSCTDNFEPSLAELIDFVTHPYFTKESVESEIGIIAEEIRMYDDHPGNRCYYGMLEGMYEHHSIRRNICGTEESISKITPELLYTCYNAFYNLHNMMLIVCGDVSPDDILRIADEHLPQSSPAFGVRTTDENAKECPEVYKSYVEQRMQVTYPMFNIGFKDVDIPKDPLEFQKKDAAMSILDEMLFSRAGKLYSHLFESGMIRPGMSFGYNIAKHSAYNSIAGAADDPKAVLEEILAYIEALPASELSYSDFLRAKRVLYADFVRSFDSTDSIANNLLDFICEDNDLLSDAKIIDSVTFEDIQKLYEKVFKREYVTLSVIKPL